MNFLKPEKKFNIKLQSPSKSLWSTIKKAYFLNKNFKSFWEKLDKTNLPEELVNYTNIFVNSASYNQVSRFWKHCLINNFNSIANSESAEKQNSIIIADYTSYTLFNEDNFKELDLQNNINNEIKINIYKKHKELSTYQSISYNIVTSLYFIQIRHLVEKYYKEINKKFYETFSSNIKINDYDINQHLMYSLIELEKIDKLLNNKTENLNILEFGAGYGRTANILFSLKKNVKYVIVDIPPSFYVSKSQFKKYHPNLKVSYGFEISDSTSMEKFIQNNDITYIFPHQLNLLKKDFFDLSIMSGVTLEMESKDVKNYMKYVDYLSKNLYMKVFKYSGLPFSFYKIYRYNVKKDYFIPKEWKENFLDIGIETDFFCHFGYRIK